jgi:tetratricopeptide (TPR) repeat protein
MLRAGLALAMIVSSFASAIAQPADSTALAQQLYDQGRELAKSDQWAEACPKFEASLRHDAALGTRLNLATCYERIGKLASAWALFRDTAALALEAGDAVRHDYALEQAAALLPRLPKLTIAGPRTPPPGFAVTRDGLAIDLATLGTALYIDPGLHEVTASAPGFEQFNATLTVGEAESASVVIREPTPSRTPVADPKLQWRKERERAVGGADPGRTRKLVGIGLAGGGAVLTGAGLLFGVLARANNNDARTLCGAELICPNDAAFEQAKDLVGRARTQATFSTALVITGIAAAVANAVVWGTAIKRERAEAVVMPVVTDRDVGFAIVGGF